MHPLQRLAVAMLCLMFTMLGATPTFAQAPAKQPNIIMIMGDDIGWANIGAYNHGVMSMRTGSFM